MTVRPSDLPVGLPWPQPPIPERVLALEVNGDSQRLLAPDNRTLLQVLRDDLRLTGTKWGCDLGECGACTVLVDGVAVNACLVLAPQVHGRAVVTVEGLSDGRTLTALQEEFIEREAVHCGFCTPGMLMSAQDLLDRQPRPSEHDIREAISGNLCRCSGYVQIIEAIQKAAERGEKARS
jgi:carbon-monoxide dehydrogenase small subunit